MLSTAYFRAFHRERGGSGLPRAPLLHSACCDASAPISGTAMKPILAILPLMATNPAVGLRRCAGRRLILRSRSARSRDVSTLRRRSSCRRRGRCRPIWPGGWRAGIRTRRARSTGLCARTDADRGRHRSGRRGDFQRKLGRSAAGDLAPSGDARAADRRACRHRPPLSRTQHRRIGRRAARNLCAARQLAAMLAAQDDVLTTLERRLPGQ